MLVHVDCSVVNLIDITGSFNRYFSVGINVSDPCIITEEEMKPILDEFVLVKSAKLFVETKPSQIKPPRM